MLEGFVTFIKVKHFLQGLRNKRLTSLFYKKPTVPQEIENQFKLQWRGKMLCAHGTNHSKGVLILFNDEGLYIFVEALV